MVDVVNRTTKEYQRSVNTPDFPIEDWIHSPDLSAVVGFPSRYWIIDGDAITLMDQAARDAVDAALLEDSRDSTVQSDIDDVESTMRQIVALMLREINILRAREGLADRTMAQAKTAIRADYGNGV